MKILFERITNTFNLLPDLTPMDGRTWFKEFSKVSFVNLVLTSALMAIMYLNTTIIGYFLYTVFFWILFIALIINDINYFIIAMERLMDAHLSPYLVYPLFIFTLLLLYFGKIVAIQIFAQSSIAVAIFVILPVVSLNILFYRYVPSKPNSEQSDQK